MPPIRVISERAKRISENKLRKMADNAPRRSSPIRAVMEALKQRWCQQHEASGKNSTLEKAEIPKKNPVSYHLRGLPWGAWQGGTQNEKVTMVQNFVSEKQYNSYPKEEDKKQRRCFNDTEFLKLLQSAREAESKRETNYGDLEEQIRKCADRMMERHEIDLDLNTEHEVVSRDPFLGADLSQFSSTNRLRRQMLLLFQKPERLDQCRRKYEDFRWGHKKQINSFRQDVLSTVGQPCAVHPGDVDFPTTVTFNVLEDFKTRLHGREFKSDEELLTCMKQINIVYKQEKKYLKEINRITRSPNWYNGRARYKANRRNPKVERAWGFSAAKVSRFKNIDPVDCALHGCRKIVRDQIKRSLTQNHLWTIAPKSGRQTRNAACRPSRRNDNIRTGEIVAEPEILCFWCHRQTASSVDFKVIPIFWIMFLSRAGHLCDQKHSRMTQEEPEVPVSVIESPNNDTTGRGSRETDPEQQLPVHCEEWPKLPFVTYEKNQNTESRLRRKKAFRKKNNILVALNVGLHGTAIRNNDESSPATAENIQNELLYNYTATFI